MSIAQINISLKLDHAYDTGVIAFISARDVLVPIRERDSIRPTETGEIMVRFADGWLTAHPDQIKFCRRH